jgi:hypothetical protein
MSARIFQFSELSDFHQGIAIAQMFSVQAGRLREFGEERPGGWAYEIAKRLRWRVNGAELRGPVEAWGLVEVQMLLEEHAAKEHKTVFLTADGQSEQFDHCTSIARC